MKILITNDDGINSDGIKALRQELEIEHEVWTFAPDRERSGTSHSVNMLDPGKVVEHGIREYSCSGTPADCVLIACLNFLSFMPDVVISGINRGPNLGTDIIYSGTCAAARQAVLHSVRGIAVSCLSNSSQYDYTAAASFIRANLDSLVSHCADDVFINVNAPSSSNTHLEGRWSSVCRRYYHDEISALKVSGGATYCFFEPGATESTGEAQSDEAVVRSGLVSVTSVLVHPQVSTREKVGESFH
jgi:5'-nucleotidase